MPPISRHPTGAARGEQAAGALSAYGAASSSLETVEKLRITRLANDSQLAIILPDADTSYYTNAKHKRNARWEDAITEDLLHDVSARFAVLTGPAHTGIAGISMGGYGAAKLALKHPDLYGFAGVVNGSLEITRRPLNVRLLKQRWMIWEIFGYRQESRQDEDVFDILANTNHPPLTKWFIPCGRADRFYPYHEQFAGILQQRGASVRFLGTEGGHDFESWNQVLPELMNDARTALSQ